MSSVIELKSPGAWAMKLVAGTSRPCRDSILSPVLHAVCKCVPMYMLMMDA